MSHRHAAHTSSVSVAYLRPVLEWLHKQGIAIEPLLQAAGIPASSLTDNAYRIPAERFSLLLQHASQRCSSPHPGLQLGTQVDILSYGNLASVLLTCTRMGDMLNIVLKHEHLLQDMIRTHLSRHDTAAKLSFYIDASLSAVAAMLAEKEITEAIYAARYCLNGDIWPTDLFFCHAQPEDIAPYTRIFPGVVLHFSAPENAIVFDAAILDMAPRFSSPSAIADAMNVLSHAAPIRHPQQLIPLLKRECRLKLAEGVPDIDAMARHFALSRRTLQRQLQLADTSFQQVINDVRHEFAMELLNTAQLSVENIAQQLGFSEARSFRQAFRRWSGMSPDGYREQQIKAPFVESA